MLVITVNVNRLHYLFKREILSDWKCFIIFCFVLLLLLLS